MVNDWPVDYRPTHGYTIFRPTAGRTLGLFGASLFFSGGRGEGAQLESFRRCRNRWSQNWFSWFGWSLSVSISYGGTIFFCRFLDTLGLWSKATLARVATVGLKSERQLGQNCNEVIITCWRHWWKSKFLRVFLQKKKHCILEVTWVKQ